MVRLSQLLMMLALAMAGIPHASGAVPAFPGAEGFGGAQAPGGFAGAEVYRVTKLTDPTNLNSPDAVGTLRHALRESGFPAGGRIIVFDVGGTIQLHSSLDIKNLPRVYIAGQTAPSPITIYGNTTQITSSSGKVTENVVLRYLTFRKGTGDGQDAVTFAGSGLGTNLILDHVSASWSEDEVLSVANNNTNVTVQYSIISDALVNNHAYGSLVRPRISSNVTFHHNLYASNASRQPRAGTYNGETLTFDFRNNVIYNWRDRAGYAGGSSESQREFVDMNFVGNYLIAGPATESNASRAFIVDRNVDLRAYQSGNFIDSDRAQNPEGAPNGVNSEWSMFHVSNTANAGVLEKKVAPFDVASVATQPAADAYWQVVNHVGNWWWNRDSIDTRVVNNLLTNTGPSIGAAAPVASELADVLNTPTVARPPEWDSDGDGMPDYWEVAHGLAMDNSADWRLDFDVDGYTNLEEYLNEIGAFPAPVPVVFTGETSNRYELITNWRTNDALTSGTHWQPSRFDEVHLNSSHVTIDSVGQHAGLLKLGTGAHLQANDGWLSVAEGVVIGADADSATSLTLAGGALFTPVLSKGNEGAFHVTGGELHADAVMFDLNIDGGALVVGHSIDTTHILGNLTISSGALVVEIFSSSKVASLIVDGDAILGGDLLIDVFDDSVLQGTSWEIATADSFTGSFDSITEGFSLSLRGDSLFLHYGVTRTGDYNGDGIVDSADYTIWRDSEGLSGTYLAADGNGDGIVDVEDYAVWKENFGLGVVDSFTDSASAVPEPAFLPGVGIVLLGLWWRWRSRRARQ